MRIFVMIIMVLSLWLGFYSSEAKADAGTHFHCSVCNSHNHGSLWHDSDKDGTNDR